MNSAKKLLQFNFDASTFARRAPNITISQQTLEILKGIEKQHGDGRKPTTNREDIRQIYHLFIHASQSWSERLRTEFDSLKRTRQLAWALTYSENGLPRIVDKPQLRDALWLIEDRLSISALLGIFDALLQTWNTQNAGMLRTFVKKHLNDYDGRRKFVQKLKANMAWYCEANSATQLATNLLRSQVKLSDVWSYLELRDHTHHYPYFGAVATAYVSINRPRDPVAVADVVEFVEKHNNDKTSRAILSKLIEQLGNDASESLRQSVQSYVIREWQDPRIAGADVSWRNVSKEARQIFTRWITKEDLRFFFDVVAKACNDHKFAYRKAFWLAYLEHISFCRPVLRRNAEYLFTNDPQARQYYLERRPATLMGGESNQHAFIMQMGEYTFVEFSTGGACYVYDDSPFDDSPYDDSLFDDHLFRLDASEYHMHELRNQWLAKHRVIHRDSENYSWQWKFAGWLNRELGIEPLRSYRVGTYTDNNETDDIAELVQALGDEQVWVESHRALVKIGKPAVSLLIEALRDQDHRVRRRATYTLGRIGKSAQAAMPALLERLQDPKDYIRSQAAWALTKIDPLSQD